jgi:DNA-binding NarL/FixJ family response regulator
MITVLLVDDQPAVRAGLRMRLALEGDVLVVGEAESGARALELAPALDPNVILLDIEMPGMDGISAARLLRSVAPNCAILMLSLHDDADTRARAMQAGAAAFVSKHEAGTALPSAIRAAHARA